MKLTIIISLILLAVAIAVNKFTKKESFANQVSEPFVWLASAVLITIFLVPIGILYDLGKSIKEAKGRKFFYTFWLLIQALIISFCWFVKQLAIFLDLLWNVAAGELIEDIVTSEENTEFRKPNMTVSGSIGGVKLKGKLNTKTGIWFDKLLDRVFTEKNHTTRAYRYWAQYRADKNL